MFLIVIADMIEQPLQRDISIVPMNATPFPIGGRGVARQFDQLGAEFGKDRECLNWILGAIVALDRPERVIEAGQCRAILSQDAARAIEINLFPIREVGQNLDYSPSTVESRSQQRLRFCGVKYESFVFVRKVLKCTQDLIARSFDLTLLIIYH